jgi:hypothetical protein
VRNLFQIAVLLGLPGVAVGMVLGRVLRSWKAVALLAVLGGLAFYAGFQYGPEGDPDEDDDPVVVLYIALLTNSVTYAVGLVLGHVARR